MSYIIRLREEAEQDLSEAATWYELQQTCLGHDFLDSVQLQLNSIADNPLKHPLVYKKLRRALLSRFPFCIYFMEIEHTIIVFAVIHASRKPSSWQRRI